MNKPIPCINCICIAICKFRTAIKCSLLYSWVTTGENFEPVDKLDRIRQTCLPYWVSIEKG